MAFGTGATGILSRTTSATAQVADKMDENGKIVDSTSHGATFEITEETYTDTFTNSATNGQTGTDIITAHDYNEVNDDYAKQTVTHRNATA
jgi:hypothetical protein